MKVSIRRLLNSILLSLAVICGVFLLALDHSPLWTSLSLSTRSVSRLFTMGGKHRTLVSNCPASLVMEKTQTDLIMQNRSKSALLEEIDFNDHVYKDKVLILTPMSNAGSHIGRYFSNLCGLTYPHELLSIVIGEDSSEDDTYQQAQNYAYSAASSFSRVEVHQMPGLNSIRPISMRHDMGFQMQRRGHLAASRNRLLFSGLKDESWVLWLDSDVRYIPRDIIERLLSAEKEIVVPACMYLKGSHMTPDVYDKNTWKETEKSKNFLKKKGDEFLMLEGYSTPMRLYINKLRNNISVVEMDGVGGCVLLVHANLHRDGLVFPPFVFSNHIETEGLARMAQRMGHKIYGMPYVEVYHD